MPAFKPPMSRIAKFCYGSAATTVFLALYIQRANATATVVDDEFLTRYRLENTVQRNEGPDGYSRLRSITDRANSLPPGSGFDQLRTATMPSNAYVARDLKELEPHLKVGDIVLFYGTGAMSWRITRLAYLCTGFDLDALRFSHVGVVVSPLPESPSTAGGAAELKKRRKDTAASTAESMTPLLDALRKASAEPPPPGAMPGHNVLILEAIDNKDCNAPCILPSPGTVLHDQVQVSRLADRAFGVEPKENRWCYNRVAVRRLEGVEWTPERLAKLEKFLQDNLGRPMEKSPTLALAMADPVFYSPTTPRTISCSEIVAAMYRAIDIMPDCPRDSPWRGTAIVPNVMYAPYHFTTSGQRMCRREYLRFNDRSVSLGSEERVDMSITKTPPPVKTESTPATVVSPSVKA